MLEISKIQQLNNGKVFSSLRETSLDVRDDEVKEPMTESNVRVVNFDKVKRIYMNEHGMSEDRANSVDALFQVKTASSEDAGIYMIEFKNGEVKPRIIERKVRDSVLIFQSITRTQLEHTRQNVHFVLVYNAEINCERFREKKAMHLANLGNIDFERFGLAHLRGFCFKEVKAYDQEMFEKKIVPLIT